MDVAVGSGVSCTNDVPMDVAVGFPLEVPAVSLGFPMEVLTVSSDFPMKVAAVSSDFPMEVAAVSSDFPMEVASVSSDFPMEVAALSSDCPMKGCLCLCLGCVLVLCFDAPVGSGMYSGLRMLKIFLFLTAYCLAAALLLLYRPISATITLPLL